MKHENILERVYDLARQCLAWQKVKQNGGAAGIGFRKLELLFLSDFTMTILETVIRILISAREALREHCFDWLEL
jgi:hypothetical protein